MINEHQIRDENEVLKIAISHIKANVFVYDFSTGKVCFIDNALPPLGLPREFEDGVNFVLGRNVIDAECVDEFRKMFEKLQQGESFANATLKTWNVGCSCWHHVLMTNCFDAQRRPARIVGTMQDVTERVLNELNYSKEEQFRLAMMAENRRVYEVNVTRNRFKKLESMEDSTDSTWQSYAESMKHLCKTRIYIEDWDDFLKIAEPKNLLKGFEEGVTEFYCEYRTMEEGGALPWSSSSTHLLKDPVTGDVKGFIYVKDIDAQKRQELLLRQQAERDPLTGLYNRAAAEKLISKILLEADAGRIYGFLSIDIDEFKTVNDTFGHVQGDILLKQFANGFAQLIRNGDVLARMGGDEFIVFLSNVSSASDVKEIADRLCTYAHSVCIEGSKDVRPSISVGIAVYPKNGRTFTELYKNSDSLLYYAKQSGKNRVAALY